MSIDPEIDYYTYIENKYGKLMWSIATKISGDTAIASVEDNYQDLWITVHEAIEGFSKQDNGSNGPVKKWLFSGDFGKYLKTCLWNRKNHKGKNISSRYAINRDTFPINDEILQIPSSDDLTFSDMSSDFGVFVDSLSKAEAKVIACILSDPDKYLTVEGKVKIKRVQQHLGWTRLRTIREVDRIKKKMNKVFPRGI